MAVTGRGKLVPLNARAGFLYLEHAKISVDDGAPVALLPDEREVVIPAAMIVCVMLGPGTSISHTAIGCFAEHGTLVLWVGEQGVRLYAAGRPGRATGERIQAQALVCCSAERRLEAARRLYRLMIGGEPPAGRSVEQLRGLEGVWVRRRYQDLAEQHQVAWTGRKGLGADPINRAISQATSTLYCVAEAALLAAGFTPALGIVHRGDARSLVFDVADTVKFSTVVPEAFRLTAENASAGLSSRVRRACRDLFSSQHLAERLIRIANHVVLNHALDGR